MRANAGIKPEEAAAEEAQEQTHEREPSLAPLTAEQFAAVFKSNRQEAEEPLPSVFHSNRRPRKEESPIDMPLTPNPEDALDPERVQEILKEGTPEEKHSTFRAFMKRASEKLGGKKSAESSTERLANRSKELDTEAKNIGGLETWFRGVGERYNEIGWKQKLAVGLSLGVGAGVLSAVSMPAAVACLSGIAAQRIAGLSSAFLNYEKSTQEGEWKKEKAMAKAIGKATLMTGAMLLLVEGVKESVEYVQTHHVGDATEEWLKQHWPFGHAGATSREAVGKIAPVHGEAPQSVPPLTQADVNHYAASSDGSLPQAVMNAAHESDVNAWSQLHPGQPYPGDAVAGATIAKDLGMTSPESGAVAHAAAAGESAATAHLPEMPSVGASSHGYEGMMKDLWGELHKHTLPANVKPGSDLAKLLGAHDKASLDSIVHDIAKEHGFFHDGESIRIDTSAHMTIGSDGQLHFADATHADVIHAAPDMHAAAAVHEAPIHPHPEAVHAEPLPPAETVTTPEVATVDVTAVQPPAPVETAIPHPVVHEQGYLLDSSGHPVTDGEGAPIHTGSYEAPAHEAPTAHAAVEHAATPAPEAPLLTKLDGASIHPNVPAIYQAHSPSGETYLAAYGGTDESRFKFIQDFLLRPENQGKTIRFAHSVPSILGSRVVVDELGARTAAGHTSWIAGFFSKPTAVPDPRDFEKLIK